MSDPIKHTSQAIDNWSFDEDYNVSSVELVAENAAGTALKRVKADDDGHLQVDVLSGGGTEPFTTYVNTALTLTNADTAYLCPASEQASRKAVQIYNGSDTDVYIGGSAVTSSNGILLTAGGVMSLDAASGIYATCASAGKIIRIMEIK